MWLFKTVTIIFFNPENQELGDSGMSMEASSSVDNRGPWTRGVSTESKEEDYYIVKMHLIMSSSPTPNI